jgi:hypothetical protein
MKTTKMKNSLIIGIVSACMAFTAVYEPSDFAEVTVSAMGVLSTILEKSEPEK